MSGCKNYGHTGGRYGIEYRKKLDKIFTPEAARRTALKKLQSSRLFTYVHLFTYKHNGCVILTKIFSDDFPK